MPLAHQFGASKETISAPRRAVPARQVAHSRAYKRYNLTAPAMAGRAHLQRERWLLKRISAVSSDMCLWHTNLGLRPKLSLHPVVLPARQVAHSRAYKRYNLTAPAMAGPAHLQRERWLLNGFRLSHLTCTSGTPIWGFDRSYLCTPSCCLRGK